jgi:hypothetical protein
MMVISCHCAFWHFQWFLTYVVPHRWEVLSQIPPASIQWYNHVGSYHQIRKIAVWRSYWDHSDSSGFFFLRRLWYESSQMAEWTKKSITTAPCMVIYLVQWIKKTSKSRRFLWLWHVFWSKFTEILMDHLTAEKWLPSLHCYFGREFRWRHQLRLVLTSCPYFIVHTPSLRGFR